MSAFPPSYVHTFFKEKIVHKGTKRYQDKPLDARHTLNKISKPKSTGKKNNETEKSSEGNSTKGMEDKAKNSSTFLEKGPAPPRPPVVGNGNGCGEDFNQNQEIMNLLQQLIVLQKQQLQILQLPQLQQMSPTMMIQNPLQLRAFHPLGSQ